MQRWNRLAILALGLSLWSGTLLVAEPPVEELPPPSAAPIVTEAANVPQIEPARTEECDRTLPINLPTALRLADARPLIIEAARASVEVEYGRLQQAKALWLPTLYVGIDYQRHDGGFQRSTGEMVVNSRQQFLAGGGALAIFAVSDAIYEPLAARQLLRARQFDVQAAKNDALLAVAEAYFHVQEARGRLAGLQDSVTKAKELVKKIDALGAGLTPRIEVERARTTLAELEQLAASAREDWRFASAELTRALRLDPAAIAIPLEPPYLQVTLISPRESVDALIPLGLTNRPELASQQALVQATLTRLRQERLRPLIPSLVLQSAAVPGQRLGGGIYGNGVNSSLDRWAGRSDWDVEVLWELRNLGFGNRGLVTERRGQNRLAVVELLRVQDAVAAEITQAHAKLESATFRVQKAEQGVKSALASYEGNVKGLGETIRLGQILQLVNRPQEVVAALLQLRQAYSNYFASINDYNRAQFRLFRALGYPAEGLACGMLPGDILPVDPSRPQMAPVCAPEPCCPH